MFVSEMEKYSPKLICSASVMSFSNLIVVVVVVVLIIVKKMCHHRMNVYDVLLVIVMTRVSFTTPDADT